MLAHRPPGPRPAPHRRPDLGLVDLVGLVGLVGLGSSRARRWSHAGPRGQGPAAGGLAGGGGGTGGGGASGSHHNGGGGGGGGGGVGGGAGGPPGPLGEVYSGLQAVFLGTSSAVPTQTRNVQSVAVRAAGEVWVFDAGEGTQRQLGRVRHAGLRPSRVTRVFVTHLHGDHVFGLPGLLLSVGHSALSTQRGPVHVYGPPGIGDLLTTCLRRAEAALPQQILVSEFASSAPHVIHEDEGFVVSAGLIRHTIPCWGFVVQEKHKLGEVLVDRLRAAGLTPGPMLREVKSGRLQHLQLPSGQQVPASQFLGPPRLGRKLVLGDTHDPSALAPLAHDCDVLVHESTLPDELRRRATTTGHSTPTMAAAFARQCAAHNLVLTHFSARFEERGGGDGDDDPDAYAYGTVADLVESARRTFQGPVVAARDFLAIDVPLRPFDGSRLPLRVGMVG